MIILYILPDGNQSMAIILFKDFVNAGCEQIGLGSWDFRKKLHFLKGTVGRGLKRRRMANYTTLAFSD